MTIRDVIDRAINLRGERYCHNPEHCFNRALLDCGQVYRPGILTPEDLDRMFDELTRFASQRPSRLAKYLETLIPQLIASLQNSASSIEHRRHPYVKPKDL